MILLDSLEIIVNQNDNSGQLTLSLTLEGTENLSPRTFTLLQTMMVGCGPHSIKLGQILGEHQRLFLGNP